MAKIEFKGIAEYEHQLRELGAGAEGVCKYAIYEAAGIVADAIRANTPESQDGGDLKNSIALTPMRNDNGFVNTKVVFAGEDRKGVSNAWKARWLESGNSKQPKHQFIRPAVNRVKRAAEFAIDKALNDKLNQMMK